MHIKSPTANLLNANPQKWVKSPRAQNHTSLRILSPMSKNTQKSEIPNSVIQEIADCILKSSDFENLQKIKKYFNSEIKEEKSNRMNFEERRKVFKPNMIRESPIPVNMLYNVCFDQLKRMDPTDRVRIKPVVLSYHPKKSKRAKHKYCDTVNMEVMETGESVDVIYRKPDYQKYIRRQSIMRSNMKANKNNKIQFQKSQFFSSQNSRKSVQRIPGFQLPLLPGKKDKNFALTPRQCPSSATDSNIQEGDLSDSSFISTKSKFKSDSSKFNHTKTPDSRAKRIKSSKKGSKPKVSSSISRQMVCRNNIKIQKHIKKLQVATNFRIAKDLVRTPNSSNGSPWTSMIPEPKSS